MHKQADLNNTNSAHNGDGSAGSMPSGNQGTLPNNKSDMDAAR